jgi:hypothetical protein
MGENLSDQLMASPLYSVIEKQDDSAEETSVNSQSAWHGPLFVIGMWRSGTSLLYALLNKHPEIALLYEGDLLSLKPMFWFPTAQNRFVRRWEFWNRGLSRHGIEPKELPNEISSAGVAANRVYERFAHKKGARIGGEKSPNYFDSLTSLAKDFPQARFIVIWRDPASICRSVIRAAADVHSWFNRRGMYLRVLMGMEAMRAECDRLARENTPILELQYQDLIKSPQATMRGICNFLEIPFCPEISSLEGADRSAIYEGEHHALVNGESIVSPATRLEVLPDALKHKIGRYLGAWKQEYGKTWCLASDVKPERPSELERAFDWLGYRGLRTLDAAIALLYCFAPIWLLSRFRAIKYKKEEIGADKRQIPSSSSESSNPARITSHSK